MSRCIEGQAREGLQYKTQHPGDWVLRFFLRTPQQVCIKRLEKAWGQLNHGWFYDLCHLVA
jgi:hypothetical protein